MIEDLDPDLTEDEEEFVDDGSDALVDENSPLMDLEHLTAKIRQLVELRTKRDKDAAVAKKSKEAFERFQADFFEEYERSPLKKGVTVDLSGEFGDVQIVPRKTNFARILDRDKAVEYFTERNKLDEYVKDDFRMKRLHELVREHIEQKKPLPPGIDFYTTEYFTITFKD